MSDQTIELPVCRDCAVEELVLLYRLLGVLDPGDPPDGGIELFRMGNQTSGYKYRFTIQRPDGGRQSVSFDRTEDLLNWRTAQARIAEHFDAVLMLTAKGWQRVVQLLFRYCLVNEDDPDRKETILSYFTAEELQEARDESWDEECEHEH